MCTRESAIVQWHNVLITVSLLNQDFTHWSDRDFIITSEKLLLVIFRPSLIIVAVVEDGGSRRL